MTSYIALGSNLGDRHAYFDAALAALAAHPRIRVVAESERIVTAPVGGPLQPDFLNAVVELDTDLEAEELLQVLTAIESANGRVRAERWCARTLDLDLLLHGEQVLVTGPVLVPHPRLAERAFVLVPLAQLAPDLVVPGRGCSVAQLLRALRSPVPLDSAPPDSGPPDSGPPDSGRPDSGRPDAAVPPDSAIAFADGGSVRGGRP